MTIYSLKAKDLEVAYDHLRDLAKTYEENKTGELSYEPLNPVDFVKDFSDRKSKARNGKNVDVFSLKVQDRSNGKIVSVSDTFVVKRFYDELCLRDRNADGDIDSGYAEDDLIVTDDMTSQEIDSVRRREIMQNTQDSIFQITTKYEVQDDGDNNPSGYAFIIGREELPNGEGFRYHAAATWESVDYVRRNEKSYRLDSVSGNFTFEKSVQLLGVDPIANLGFLEWTSTADLKVLDLLPEDEKPTLQEPVLTVGKEAESGKFIDREIGRYELSDFHPQFAWSRIETSETAAAATQDQLGKPVMDAQGRVVGMIVQKDSETVRFRFLVTSDRLQKSYQNVLNHKENKTAVYSDWGLEFGAIDFSNPLRNTFPDSNKGNGVLITDVHPDSPGSRAGLRQGDILLSVDGDTSATEVGYDVDLFYLMTTIRESDTEKPVKLKVYRTRTSETLTFKLTPQSFSLPQQDTFETTYGFNILELDERTRYVEQIPDDVQGVYVSKRERDKNGSPTSGDIIPCLRHGQLITAVNDTATPDVETFRSAFEKALEEGKPIRLETHSTPDQYDGSRGGIGAIGYAILEP